MSERETHPPAARLRNRRDFSRVFRRNKRGNGRNVTVLLARRPKRAPRRPRLGVVVSTRVDKRAVRRHQLKRWARELFRRELQHRLGPVDMVVLLRHDPPFAHDEFVSEVSRALAKARRRL